MDLLNKTIGKYRLTRFIGEGGMAAVYEGEHEMLGTKVAVKVLNPILSVNTQIRERFKNEAKLMASLDHPNITKVIDFDDQPQQLSIIMELLNGGDLNQKIRKEGALSEQQCLSIFEQAISAMQYAHERGIVHRDIKPSNIFILPGGKVKILDFGIAKLFGQGNEATQTGTQMGTPIYMSPEQVRADKSIDHRSDIYSLGVTMYYALKGQPPYDSNTHSQFDIFNKIVFEPLPKLEGPAKLASVIEKACQKDREQRFQSCNEFMIALNTNGAEGPAPATVNFEKTTTSTSAENISAVPKKKPLLIAGVLVLAIALTFGAVKIYHNSQIQKGISYFKKEQYKKAYDIFSNSSLQDNSDVQYYLGKMYSSGFYVKADQDLAFSWFNKSADQNNAKGINALALAYQNGKGTEKNMIKAVSLFEKAAELGSLKAYHNLGVVYYKGYLDSADYKKAMDYFLLSLDEVELKGSSENYIGLMYRDGLGVEKSLKTASEWFLKGIEKGSSIAMVEIGYMYEMGNPFETNLEKAYEYYKMSAELNNAIAQSNLGTLLLNGRGCEKNDAEAFKWLEKSADQNCSNGQANLGYMYEFGRHVSVDRVKAIRYYQMASEQGNEYAKSRLRVLTGEY